MSYVLSFLRRKIKLRIGIYRNWNEVELQHFATAIRHNPFIKSIRKDGFIPITCFYIFANVLATLPALEDVYLFGFAQQASVSMQMQVLIQSRSLRSLTFHSCCITREIVECLALALNGDGSTLTCLRFDLCDFLDKGPDDIAKALRTSTSLTLFECVAVPYTMRGAFVDPDSFLRINASLKSLTLVYKETDARNVGHVCTATLSVLVVNTSLECLDIEINNGDESISSVEYLAALAALGPNTTQH